MSRDRIHKDRGLSCGYRRVKIVRLKALQIKEKKLETNYIKSWIKQKMIISEGYESVLHKTELYFFLMILDAGN